MKDKNVGKIIGIFRIIEATAEREKGGHLLYIGECIYCGKRVKRRLVTMKETSICTHKRYNDGVEQKHLHVWKFHRLQSIYRNMKSRCYNINNKSYCWYGAKGIKICNEWISDPGEFEKWAIESGYTDGLTIDRINPNGDYEPNNCRWLSQEDNSRRAGRVNWITVGDVTLTGRQWANKLGYSINYINVLVCKEGIEEAAEFIKRELSNQN